MRNLSNSPFVSGPKGSCSNVEFNFIRRAKYYEKAEHRRHQSVSVLAIMIVHRLPGDVARICLQQGNDANAATNCAQTAPCRTFAGPFPTVTAGGKLIALDFAGYGPLTINKPITVASSMSNGFRRCGDRHSRLYRQCRRRRLVAQRNIDFNRSNAANTTGINHTSGKLDVYHYR